MFLDDPGNYELGLQNLCFSKFIFIRWLLYGVWQGALVFFMCFIPYEWQGGSYWLEGNFAYTGVVIIANVKVLNSISNHTVFSFIAVLGSVIFFLLVSTALNFIPGNDLYGILAI